MAPEINTTPIAPKKKLHIAVFPWLAFGHMIPFHHLANLLAAQGHRISFLSTPRNIHRLPKTPPHLSLSFNFVPLHLPQIPGLPPAAESTADLPPGLVPYLKLAHDGLEPAVTRFLDTHRPDWIIYDFAPHWLPPAAAKAGTSRALFSVMWAATFCFLAPGSAAAAAAEAEAPRARPEDFTVPPKWVPFPSSVAYRLHEARRFFEPPPLPPEGVVAPVVVGDLERGEAAVNGCDVMALRTCPELERDWLDLTGQLYGKPVVPAGLLIPSGPEPEPEGPWVAASEWLGKQRRGSVVYVAFGSEVSLTKNEMTELALGLELAGVPFLWVIRKGKAGGSAEEDDEELLPEGFDDRIKAKGIGLVHTGWAPQVQILAHGSVGGFLTHCGWGSVVEALRYGRPLIMLPIHVVDQGLIARTFAERGAGVEVARDEEDGHYSSGSVAESVRAVMGEESGRRYRDKAEEMRAAVFGNTELQDRCLRGFVSFLENYNKNI